MTTTPPIPEAAQSPYPIAEPPHEQPSMIDQTADSLGQSITAAREAAGPIVESAVDRAKTFVKQRPWTAAALIGSIGLAVFNSVRGKRPWGSANRG